MQLAKKKAEEAKKQLEKEIKEAEAAEQKAEKVCVFVLRECSLFFFLAETGTHVIVVQVVCSI